MFKVVPVKILRNWLKQRSEKILVSKIIIKHQRKCSNLTIASV